MSYHDLPTRPYASASRHLPITLRSSYPRICYLPHPHIKL